MKKITVVEDDIAIRAELTELLHNAGYQTAIIENFTDVTSQIVAHASDLVLLDINLPGQNGQMLLHELRKISQIPVIMVTSRTSEQVQPGSPL